MIHDLEAIAGRWLGTPFSANACVPGHMGGVSCQALAAAMYIELGVLPTDAEIPTGRINRGRFSRESEITPWVDGRFEFQRQADLNDVQPGDLLGFQVGHCVNHCGVALSSSQFIHCIERAGVNVSSLQDATWLSRLVVRWSPRGGLL